MTPTTVPAAVRSRSGRLIVPGNRWDLAPASPLRPISVIVPYYESPDDLHRLLAGLDRQTVTPHEVIVVDDGSSRAPARDVLAGRPDVRVLWQPDAGVRPAAARNLGADAATGEVLVFLDGDVIPHPNCLRHLAALPSALPDAIVVGRRAHADLEGLTPEETLRLIARPRREPGRWLDDMDWLSAAYAHTGDLLHLDVRGWRYVISAVMAMHASTFSDIGGFDGDRVGYGGEDWELAHRALHAGAVLAHAPDALVVHNGPDLAGRDDARPLKNAETTWLLGRVSDRTFRPRGLRVGGPRVVVVCRDEGWDDAALLSCVDSLLGTLGDAHVHLTGRSALPAWAAADTRVRLGDPRGRPHPARPGGPLAHVETLWDLSRPVLLDPDGAEALLGSTDPGRLDRIEVHDDAGGVVLTVTAARMAARIARAAADAEDGPALWARIGAGTTVRGAEVGLQVLQGVIDLEATLDRPTAGPLGERVGMPVASDPLRIVVTAAPGTGSTSLLAWSRGLPEAVDLLEQDLLNPDGTVQVDAKHATVTRLIEAGVWRPVGHAIVTSTRNPFDHWHAEWFRTRTRWAEDAADPESWVHRVPGMRERIRDARRLPFAAWLEDALASPADAGETRHLNPGHVTEADVVLRMEHLEADLANALPGLAAHSPAIPHRNRTGGRPPYTGDYTPRARALVEQVHAPDLARFGYRF